MYLTLSSLPLPGIPGVTLALSLYPERGPRPLLEAWLPVLFVTTLPLMPPNPLTCPTLLFILRDVHVTQKTCEWPPLFSVPMGGPWWLFGGSSSCSLKRTSYVSWRQERREEAKRMLQ